MSVENVKAFYEKVSKDGNVANKIKENKANFNGDQNNAEALANAVILPVAKEIGLDFTFEDLVSYQKELSKSGELSDDCLDSVAGGYDCGVELELFKELVEKDGLLG